MPHAASMRQGLVDRLIGRLGLRFPTLFLLFAGLTLADIVVPDVIPLADEIGLAMLTALFGTWRRRRERR